MNSDMMMIFMLSSITLLVLCSSPPSAYAQQIQLPAKVIDLKNVAEMLEPEIKFLSLAILSPDRADVVLPIPEDGKPKGLWFTLKEGSRYSLRFSFKVSSDIVSEIRYISTVSKGGRIVDRTEDILGTFSPREEPYTHVIPDDITPSGILARSSSYSVKAKFCDGEKCYFELNYTYNIRKDWASL